MKKWQMIMIGKIEKVPLRNVWKYEAWDLADGYQRKINVLCDEISLDRFLSRCSVFSVVIEVQILFKIDV